MGEQKDEKNLDSYRYDWATELISPSNPYSSIDS